MTNILETTSFGATSTTDDVLSGVNLKGKRILVTGVSAGIGVETARSLVAHAARKKRARGQLDSARYVDEIEPHRLRRHATCWPGRLGTAEGCEYRHCCSARGGRVRREPY